jgi:hypothetical protein
MSEEERRARLVEVIEMGEELFEMALAGHGQEAGAQDAGDETEQARQEVHAGDTGDLRAAAETFFRVLRRLAVTKESAEG